MNGQKTILKTWNIDRTWSVFLDRDGVINQRIENGYVTCPEDFIFLPGVTDALKIFHSFFRRIIVVTNQQGIGKGIMTEKDLERVHGFMLKKIHSCGGRIDAVYHSPYLAGLNHPMRKPNIGMALKAKEDFPEIDFSRSVMIGDSDSDILFGKTCGMKTVFINPDMSGGTNDAELCVSSLYEFAECLNQLHSNTL